MGLGSMSHLWVLSAASGTGKTSLVKALLDKDENIQVAISHTTRAPREGEVNGQDYHFVSKEVFETLMAKSAFVETAKVFDHFYGTSRDEVQSRLKCGFDVILEIDWQGAEQICKTMPAAKSIFILPPSYQQLRNRLESRGKDDQKVIERRLSEARLEISKSSEFDYWVVNDDFSTALSALSAIIQAHRYEKAIMEQRHPNLVRGLCDSK